MRQVYITRLSKFLPNEPVECDDMEEILGFVGDKPSKARRIVLRSNGIKTRYYSLNKAGKIIYSNAEMAAKAVEGLYDSEFTPESIELLSCGTSIPDQLMPSHSSMVHGYLKAKPLEIASLSGICCSGMHALKYGYLSVLAGNSTNAVCTGSELSSVHLHAKNFKAEISSTDNLEQNPYLAFEKDFLRWMLSDGAGAALLEDKPLKDKNSLRIDWIESISFANEVEACMYAGAEKVDGKLYGWSQFETNQLLSKSILSVKQDVKLLEKNIIRFAVEKMKQIFSKREIQVESLDYILPHLSSEFFRKKFDDGMKSAGINIPQEKWFTNLTTVGNVGSASIYIMLEELFNSGKLQKGQKLFLIIPESGRFSYVFIHLTVV